MIKFIVTISQEGPHVRFRVETPAGNATLKEMDLAREFQKMVSKFGKENTDMQQEWKGTNDPARQ